MQDLLLMNGVKNLEDENEDAEMELTTSTRTVSPMLMSLECRSS
jgi:hypothetical protein